MAKKVVHEFIGEENSRIKYDAGRIPVLDAHLSEPPHVVRVLRPKIDLKVCKNNYDCIIFCPHDAIGRNEHGRPVINYDACTGCLICLRECPTNAISEERDI